MIGETSSAAFPIQPYESVLAITPALNGASLTDMASAFECEHHFEPAGGYGGLIPQWFEYGPGIAICAETLSRTVISQNWLASIF